VFAGDIVPKKKPAPDIYVFAQEHMQVSPSEALVIEDSRNGLLAAVGAGLRCVVTLSSYTTQEDMHEAILVVSQLGDPGNSAQVIANHGRATPGPFITLSDLKACLES
jgi:beta-phosphoglucomutase-like phosphatase (HAD superfamily)